LLNKYIKCNFRGLRCGTTTIVDIRHQKVKHDLQQILSTQAISWSLILQPKIQFIILLMSLDNGFLCDFNTTSLQMWQKLFRLFWQECDMLHTRKILLKRTGKLSFALVQHSGWRVESDWGFEVWVCNCKTLSQTFDHANNIWATICHSD